MVLPLTVSVAGVVLPLASAAAGDAITVFPGIREILNELSARLPLVIATSKPRALAEPPCPGRRGHLVDQSW